MIDWGKIGCHWGAERHETIRTFQNVLPRHLADGFVEIGFDKRGEICFYKCTHIANRTRFHMYVRVQNIFLKANRFTIGGTTVVIVWYRCEW
jgi:hypothetical protein